MSCRKHLVSKAIAALIFNFIFGMLGPASAEATIDKQYGYISLTPHHGSQMSMRVCKIIDGKESCLPLLEQESNSCFIFNPTTELERSFRKEGLQEALVMSLLFYPVLFLGNSSLVDANILAGIREVLNHRPDASEVIIGVVPSNYENLSPTYTSITAISNNPSFTPLTLTHVYVNNPTKGFNPGKEAKFIWRFREMFSKSISYKGTEFIADTRCF